MKKWQGKGQIVWGLPSKTLEKAALGSNMLDAVRVPPTPIGHFFPHFFKYGCEKINKESIQLRTNRGRIDLFRTNIDEKSVQYQSQSNNLVLTSFDNYCTIGNRSDDVLIVERYIYLPNIEIGPVDFEDNTPDDAGGGTVLFIKSHRTGELQKLSNVEDMQLWQPRSLQVQTADEVSTYRPDNTPKEESMAQTIEVAMSK